MTDPHKATGNPTVGNRGAINGPSSLMIKKCDRRDERVNYSVRFSFHRTRQVGRQFAEP